MEAETMATAAAAATPLMQILKWVWEQYGKEITDKAAKAVWNEISWEDSAVSYREKIGRLYGTVQIFGQSEPVALEDIYTSVQLLDRPTALRRYTLEEMQAEFVGQQGRYFYGLDSYEKRQAGLAMVKGGKNLFILGKPGAGKTTFLKYIAVQAANGQLERVPIFVGLKQLSDTELSVFDFVVNEFGVCNFPQAGSFLDRLLREGKGIVLFDGLDEVNEADHVRRRLITDVENFVRKYDRCQHLITCRLAADTHQFNPFTYVEMADFNESQMRAFIGQWFRGDRTKREKRELFLVELFKPGNEGLRELAQVPLLLALLCLAFEETLKLSERRVELYEEALDALLKKWDGTRNIRRKEIYRELSLQRKRHMLAFVASGSFERGEYFFNQKMLVRQLETFLRRVPGIPETVDGEEVLDSIIAEHGLFAERARGIYSFAHLTFQEYFTARYFYEQPGALSRLMEHITDRRWREVFLLTAALLSNADYFFDLFLQQLTKEVNKRLPVVNLLRWTADKANAAQTEGLKPVAASSYYLSLTLARALAHALARDLDLARALALAFTRDLDLSLSRDLAVVRADARTGTLDLEAVHTHAHSLALDLSRSPYHQLAIDTVLVNGWLIVALGAELKDNETRDRLRDPLQSLLEAVMTKCKLLGLRDICATVQKLSVPNAGSDVEVWATLRDQLQRMIVDQRGLPFDKLSLEDWDVLNDYLVASQLLVECLEQAVVTDRGAIEERLLLV